MIGGSKKEKVEQQEFTKKVGLFEAKVIAINPDAEEYKEVLNIELKEDSKAVEYLSKNQEGDAKLRVDVWLEDVKSSHKFKATFYLEDKERENKDGSKKQYINNVGVCSWADDPNNLAEWFSKKDYRVAFVGEEELYNFLRTWLSGIDYRADDAVLQLDFKKLMKGNVKELKEQINGAYCGNVVALATVKTVIKDDETKEYQNIYTKAFLPAYAIKQFRVLDYSDGKMISVLSQKKAKDLKPHEKFVVNIYGEYGCKDYFILKDLKDYNPDENVVASNKVISEDGSDF